MTRPGVDVHREAVRRAVAASSQRAVAAQIGISYRGVGKFLAGAEPYEKTRQKLQAWYVSRAVPPDVLTADVARLAVLMLVDAVPPERRAEAVREIVATVERTHRVAGVE